MSILIFVGLVLVVGLAWIMKVAMSKDAAEEVQLTSEQIQEEPVVQVKPKKTQAKKAKTPKKVK